MSQPTTHHRYRPPVRVPLRNLVVAAASATLGSLEIIAAAGLGLPRSVLQAGVILVVVAAVMALWSWRQYRSRQWTVVVADDGVTVRRPRSSRRIGWDELNAVALHRTRLELWDRRGQRTALALDARDSSAGPLVALVTTLTERLP